jgi:glucose-6-phosphate isomerase
MKKRSINIMPIIWTYKNFTTFNTSNDCKLTHQLKDILPDFVEKTSKPNKPILSLPAVVDDLAEIESHAKRISERFKDVIVVGVGGSSLGGQAIIEACAKYNNNRPNMVFTDNLSPTGFPHLLTTLDPENTHILTISKSGTTMELHVQLAFIMEWLGKSNCTFKNHITVITEKKTSPLKKLIEIHDLPSLDHLVTLGGRFSVLSNIGLLPAAIAGVNIRKVRRGAQEVIDVMKAAKNPADVPAAVGAAHIVSQHQKNNVNISVLFLYADRLRKFGEWYCQLWAESLGKKGVGTTPVIAQGPLDQHSQLQLYMEGPRDKSYSFITIGREPSTTMTIPHILDDIGMSHLSGLTLHNVVKAMSEGTLHALRETGQPTRNTHIENLNEQSMGRLFMHFFLETKFASSLLDINPHGQPGVERGKDISNEFLRKLNSTNQK